MAVTPPMMSGNGTILASFVDCYLVEFLRFCFLRMMYVAIGFVMIAMFTSSMQKSISSSVVVIWAPLLGLAVGDVFDVFDDGCYCGDAGEDWYEWDHGVAPC